MPTIIQVDAFTSQPFAGNPAAVCVLSTPQDPQWMQNVAQEMNLSETAFLVKQSDGFDLRWFTPTTEVDLCGHATLASAHVLWSEGHLPPQIEARFQTRSGLLTANLQSHFSEESWIELNFPAISTVAIPVPINLSIASGIPVHQVYEGSIGLVIEVDSEITVRNMQPNFELLKTIPYPGVVVTSQVTMNSQTGSKFDFVSRYFAPNFGINEDPVTGSAHCCLATFWCDRLKKTEFLAYQASARGGVIKVRCEGDRVFLGGQAVTVLRGDLLV